MNTKIRLIQLDGKIPNIALAKLAHWHRSQNHDVHLSRTVQQSLFEPAEYDITYASTIFTTTQPQTDLLRQGNPDAIIAGTGKPDSQNLTVEQVIGVDQYEHYDYSIYPEYSWSIGFTQRGCRLRCPFCVVPDKEGQPRPVNTIHDIWRRGQPKNIVLLDNDFFGQPRQQWQDRIQEIRHGGFKISFNQGINIRIITDEAASALASIEYRDDQFKRRRLYTAWDNIGHERVFFRGLEKLNAAGIPPRHLMVYMLIGYAADETMETIFHRYNRLIEAGCLPYPMVYDPSNRLLKTFQRWVIRRYHEFVPWEQFQKRLRNANPSPNASPST